MFQKNNHNIKLLEWGEKHSHFLFDSFVEVLSEQSGCDEMLFERRNECQRGQAAKGRHETVDHQGQNRNWRDPFVHFSVSVETTLPVNLILAQQSIDARATTAFTGLKHGKARFQLEPTHNTSTVDVG